MVCHSRVMRRRRPTFPSRHPNPHRQPSSPYASRMTAAEMIECIAKLEADEIDDALFLAEVIAGQDGLPDETLADWQSRILARQRFLATDGSQPHD